MLMVGPIAPNGDEVRFIKEQQFRSNIHCASLSSFAMVPVIPLPISAALRANSDLPFRPDVTSPLGEPFASRLWVSESRACRCAPTFDDG